MSNKYTHVDSYKGRPVLGRMTGGASRGVNGTEWVGGLRDEKGPVMERA